MTILLGVFAVLAALILIIFITPVRLTVAASGGALPDRLELALWGLQVRCWRPGEQTDEPKETPATKPKTKSQSDASKLPARERVGPLLSLLVGPAGRRLAARMVRAIQIRQGWMHVLFGLRDPAQTGLIAGPAYALNPYLERLNLELEPDFSQAVFGLDGLIALETSLAQLTGPPLRFLFEPGALKALWVLAAGPSRPQPQTQAQTQTPR